MRSITSISICFILLLCATSTANAQCSEIHPILITSHLTDVCTHGTLHEAIADWKNYEVHGETACRLGGWVRNYFPYENWHTSVLGECGPTPPDTRPYCPGALEGPYDLGFDEAAGKHKIRMSETWNEWSEEPEGCDPGPTLFNDLEVISEGCMGYGCCGGDIPSRCNYEQGDFNYSICECNFATPLLIDVKGNGFQLTSFSGGIQYDLMGSGTPRQMAWTSRGSDDAFLVRDRNSNGVIDNGTELFSNGTPLLGGRSPNGFEALRSYDANHDGSITAADDVYATLLLWTDSNHNGISEPNELKSLSETGIEAISLDYKDSMRRDRYGNLLKLRSKLFGAESRFVYDVYFVFSESNARQKGRSR
jgi:hypothetical protein